MRQLSPIGFCVSCTAENRRRALSSSPATHRARLQFHPSRSPVRLQGFHFPGAKLWRNARPPWNPQFLTIRHATVAEELTKWPLRSASSRQIFLVQAIWPGPWPRYLDAHPPLMHSWYPLEGGIVDIHVLLLTVLLHTLGSNLPGPPLNLFFGVAAVACATERRIVAPPA